MSSATIAKKYLSAPRAVWDGREKIPLDIDGVDGVGLAGTLKSYAMGAGSVAADFAPVTAIPTYSETVNDTLTHWAHRSTNAGAHAGNIWTIDAIVGRPLGSGVNGPNNNDCGLTVSMIKQNWSAPSTVSGEVDGITVITRQSGPDVHFGDTTAGSDSGAFLANVVNIGRSGFICVLEGVVGNKATPISPTFAAEIDVQVGSINSTIEQQNGYGFIATAMAGTLSDGVRIQVSDSGAWTNFIRCQGTSGALKFTVNYAGLTYSSAGFQADLKTPASPSAAGVQGQIAWDANCIWVCTAPNTWKGVPIATTDGTPVTTRTRFWSDVNNGAAITTPRVLAFKERIMVGAATEYTNLARGGGPSFGWLTNANGAAWMGRDGGIVSIAEDGNVAIFGASRASDGPSGTGAVGIGSYVTADAPAPSGGWAGYFELSREHASAVGSGIELDVKNCAAGVNNGNPYGNGAGPNGLWVACGPGSGAGGYGSTPTNNSGSAMTVLCNTGGGNTFRFTKGIVIQAGALVGVNGTDGEAPGAGAIEMARGHSIRWYASGALLKAAITSKLDSTDVDWAVYWLGNSMVYARNGATENVVHLTGVASAVNYFRLTNGAAGAAPQIQAVGTDANVDVTLIPQGSGNVRYGTNTVKAAEAFASYITIKDAGGTLRKLMVCA